MTDGDDGREPRWSFDTSAATHAGHFDTEVVQCHPHLPSDGSKPDDRRRPAGELAARETLPHTLPLAELQQRKVLDQVQSTCDNELGQRYGVDAGRRGDGEWRVGQAGLRDNLTDSSARSLDPAQVRAPRRHQSRLIPVEIEHDVGRLQQLRPVLTARFGQADGVADVIAAVPRPGKQLWLVDHIDLMDLGPYPLDTLRLKV